MMKPNKLDKEIGEEAKTASVEDLLLMVAKTPRIIKAIEAEMEAHHAIATQEGWVGPSRVQAFRQALVNAITA